MKLLKCIGIAIGIVLVFLLVIGIISCMCYLSPIATLIVSVLALVAYITYAIYQEENKNERGDK